MLSYALLFGVVGMIAAVLHLAGVAAMVVKIFMGSVPHRDLVGGDSCDQWAHRSGYVSGSVRLTDRFVA